MKNQRNMHDKQKNVWVGKADLAGDTDFVQTESSKFFDLPIAQEMADDRSGLMGTNTNRRDFLKYLGFGLGAATVAASCEAPMRRAIPYVTKPDAIVPGVPTYYASSYVKGGDYCSILVKTREGRPIKIEGNKLSPITKGGTSARAQASVLELYDSSRFAGPMKNGEQSDWATVEKDIKSALQSAKGIKLISNTIISPTTKKAIKTFTSKYAGAEHVMYDAVSYSALLDANESVFGQRSIPGYQFDKADVILSMDADFLGTWLSPVEFGADWAKGRKITSKDQKKLSRLYSVESTMTLTGSNADNRVVTKPSQSSEALVVIYNVIAKKAGASTVRTDGTLDEKTVQKLEFIGEDLWESSRSNKNTLVVNGANNLGEQLITIEINKLLGNYGSTIDLGRICQLRQGDDKALGKVVEAIENGSTDVVIFLEDANPMFDTPYASRLSTALEGVGTRIAMGTRPNETSSACNYVCPIHHILESWGDAEPYKGEFSLIQPVISPLFDTKSLNELLVSMAGQALPKSEDRADYILLQNSWKGGENFSQSWQISLHDGLAKGNAGASLSMGSVNLSRAQSALGQREVAEREIKFYETINIGGGEYASNPWLMEMPDPIYRTVWDNFVTIPVSWDGNRTIEGMNGWETGDVIEVQIGGQSLEVPVVDQFGVKDGAHGMALGYGRTNSGRAASGVGINAYPHVTVDESGYFKYYAPITFGSKVGKDDEFASVQYHHTYGIKDTDPNTGEEINIDEQSISAIAKGYQGALTDRSVLFYADLAELESAADDLHHHREHAQYLNEKSIYEGYEDLYDNGHKWEMSVDLSSCYGCGACQVACIAENNVPVVGKTEVSRHHEMTWLRIDRYFFGDMESPNTAYQPMMCQHCDNAPCENVCPVGATQHSAEGLNHMTYNRCIGTRYCANNCPYKVRRFNWLDYTTADLFGNNESDPLPGEGDKPFYADNMTRMVLNPDVTVRSRGVIEKCSFCVQKIQAGKLQAKAENRAVSDGDITTACASACPAGCITFGDINDKESEVAKKEQHPLNYYVLEETNVRSAVGYLMKVTNKNEKINELDA